MLFILLTAFVCLSDAATTQHPNLACCVANKFTATILDLGANLQTNSTNPEFREGYFLMDYDYDVKKSKLDLETLDQQTGLFEDVVIYNDYPQDKLYTVSNGKCFISPIDTSGRASMTPPCIPSNFTFLRQYRLGHVSKPLMVDVFMGSVVGEQVAIHVQADDCTPIMESLYGQRPLIGDQDVSVFMFADVKQNTLSSANPFDLPDICKAAQAPIGK